MDATEEPHSLFLYKILLDHHEGKSLCPDVSKRAGMKNEVMNFIFSSEIGIKKRERKNTTKFHQHTHLLKLLQDIASDRIQCN